LNVGILAQENKVSKHPEKPERSNTIFHSQDGNWPLIHIASPVFPYLTRFVIEQVDPSGKKAIAYTFRNEVHVVDCYGEEFPNWPVDVSQIPGPNTAGSAASPVIGDIDNDGDMEIMAFFTRSISHESIQYIAAWHLESAALVEGWPVLVARRVGAIDNDRDLEVIATKRELDYGQPVVFAYQGNGKLVDNWPAMSEENSSYGYEYDLSLGDLDCDGNLDVVTSHGYQNNFSIPNCPISIVNHQGETGPCMNIERKITDSCLCNLDNDPELEIVLTSHIRLSGFNESHIEAFNHDGTVVPAWKDLPPYEFNTYCRMAVGDLENDGKNDIFVGSLRGLVAYDASGNQKWVFKDFSPDSNMVIGDVWGGPCPEIIFGAGRAIVALNKMGEQVLCHEVHERSSELENWTIAVEDLDNDGDVEILSWAYRFDNPTSIHYLLAWDLEHEYAPGSFQWPMFKRDAQHTARGR